MSKLTTLLKMLYAGPSERRELVQNLPETMHALQDGGVYKIPNVREYLLTESLEGSGLVEIELYNTVIEGAKYAVCMREVFPVVGMRTDTMRVPYGSAGIYAPLVDEGSEFPAMYQDYNYKTLTAEKYGHTIPISQELIDDAKFDLVEIELRKVGQSVENKLNQMMLTELLDNAGNEHDTGGSSQGLTAIIKAKAAILADGFYPDKVVLSPEAWGMAFVDYKPAYNISAEDVLRNGMLPQIAGVTPYICSVADNSSTYTWKYNSDTDIGMVMVDSDAAGIIGMRQDITVKQFDNVLKMVQSPVVYARFDVVYLNANAICRVEY